MKKRILEVKHTKNISYLVVRKLVENSVVTTTYAKVAKPTNNSSQNQGMTYYKMTNWIKELKTLTELLRENLTKLTSRPHAETDPKKNLQPQNKEDKHLKNKRNKNSTQTTNFKQPYNHPRKKLDINENPLLFPKKKILE